MSISLVTPKGEVNNHEYSSSRTMSHMNCVLEGVVIATPPIKEEMFIKK